MLMCVSALGRVSSPLVEAWTERRGDPDRKTRDKGTAVGGRQASRAPPQSSRDETPQVAGVGSAPRTLFSRSQQDFDEDINYVI